MPIMMSGSVPPSENRAGVSARVEAGSVLRVEGIVVVPGIPDGDVGLSSAIWSVSTVSSIQRLIQN